MQRLLALVLMCTLSACIMFTSQEEKTQELVNKELLEIDWNDVDNYPLFESCDELQSKTAQRECFEQALSKHCSNALKEFEFTLKAGIDPTVQVDFLVDKDGRIQVTEILKDEAINEQMPKFDAIIKQSLQNMPALAPALKRGIPVKAKFRIPIVLNTN